MCAPGFHCRSGARRPWGHTVPRRDKESERSDRSSPVQGASSTCEAEGGAPGPAPPTPPVASRPGVFPVGENAGSPSWLVCSVTVIIVVVICIPTCAVMFPTPPTDPDGVNTPVALIDPSSPRSIDHAALTDTPPWVAVNDRVGIGFPVITVTVAFTGAIARGPEGMTPPSDVLASPPKVSGPSASVPSVRLLPSASARVPESAVVCGLNTSPGPALVVPHAAATTRHSQAPIAAAVFFFKVDKIYEARTRGGQLWPRISRRSVGRATETKEIEAPARTSGDQVGRRLVYVPAGVGFAPRACRTSRIRFCASLRARRAPSSRTRSI